MTTDNNSNLISQLQTQEGAFKYLETILNEIQSGERLHNQEHYHTINECGTAHCIAGWIEYDVMNELKLDPYDEAPTAGVIYHIYTELGLERFLMDVIYKNFGEEGRKIYASATEMSTWAFAQSILKITYVESDMLFDMNLTIEDIISNFKIIRESYDL